MAEIGALANLAQVVGAGLQLSMVLYDFASTIGSAGKDIKAVACEISLLCRVLEQVRSTFSKAKAFRISTIAIQTTQDILDRCQEIFDDLDSVLKKLQRADSSSTDILTRVKWAFKRSKILVQKQSLMSCAATLHLMISTLDFAQKIAARPKSMSSAESDGQDEEDRRMTSSLLLAQQSINERLEDLEDRCDAEAARSPSPQPSNATLGDDLAFRHQRNKSLQSSIGRPGGQSPMAPFVTAQRTSLILNNHIFGRNSAALSTRMSAIHSDDRRQSVLQSNALLQSWTDQTDPLAPLAVDDSQQEDQAASKSSYIDLKSTEVETTPEDGRRLELETALEHTQELLHQERQAKKSLVDLVSGLRVELRQHQDQHDFPSYPSRHDYNDAPLPFLRDRRAHTPRDGPVPANEVPRDLVSRTEPSKGPFQQTSTAKPTGPFVEIFKSFRVGLEDPCYKVLPAALRKYNIQADWRQYELYLVYGDQELCVGLNDKPLAMFKELDRKGLKPQFMLRKLQINVEEPLQF